MDALREKQQQAGATFVADDGVAGPLTFGNDGDALQATQTGVAVGDRTHWGRILVSGDDRLRFLHNQTTNSFNPLQPGQGCDTVFVTSTGRTIDLVTAYAIDDAVLLLTSPGYDQRLVDWMDRFIFFADKVELKIVTPDLAAFSLLGPESEALLRQLGLDDLPELTPGSHRLCQLRGEEVRLAVGSGLAIAGYTLLVPATSAATVWAALVEAGAVPLGTTAWEQLRIQQGRPLPEQELTDDFNPLEAGLWSTISFSKGCYIGQETIARLYTYRGVKQQLWGLQLSAAVEPGSPVMAGDEKIGKLTSCTATATGYVGLAYIRTKALETGLSQVQVDGVTARLMPLPFLSHEYPATDN